jgi:hypothetical protein
VVVVLLEEEEELVEVAGEGGKERSRSAMRFS